MSAAIVFAALLVCIFPFAGLLVGLGPSRFWEALGWVCGGVAMLALSLFCGGVAAGEWMRKAAKLIFAKLKRRKSNVDGN